MNREMLKGKRLLILGGISHMIDVVNTAKNLGVFTIVTDFDSESPAKKISDKSYDISTTDIDALETIGRLERIDGVFSGFEDKNTFNALELCKRLNLPFYATKDQLEVSSNKSKFKEYCKKYNIPTVETYRIDDIKNVEIKDIEYPVIVKPVDNYGSKGITICNNFPELSNAILKAKSFSKTQTYTVEHFYTGYGVEMYYTVQNGKAYLSAMTDRYICDQGFGLPPLPIATMFPSKHLHHYIETIDPFVRDMIVGLEIKNGLVAFQAVLEEANIYLYEMAFRLTGEKHYQIVKKETAIDLLEMMVELAILDSFDLYNISSDKFDAIPLPACNLSLLVKQGKISNIQGIQQLLKIPEVVDYIQQLYTDDTVSTIGDYNQMFIRINIVAANEKRIFEIIDEINSTLKVTSETGENMIITRFSQKMFDVL